MVVLSIFACTVADRSTERPSCSPSPRIATPPARTSRFIDQIWTVPHLPEAGRKRHCAAQRLRLLLQVRICPCRGAWKLSSDPTAIACLAAEKSAHLAFLYVYFVFVVASSVKKRDASGSGTIASHIHLFLPVPWHYKTAQGLARVFAGRHLRVANNNFFERRLFQLNCWNAVAQFIPDHDPPSGRWQCAETQRLVTRRPHLSLGLRTCVVRFRRCFLSSLRRGPDPCPQFQLDLPLSLEQAQPFIILRPFPLPFVVFSKPP